MDGLPSSAMTDLKLAASTRLLASDGTDLHPDEWGLCYTSVGYFHDRPYF